MNAPIRELHRTEMPRTLVMLVAMACGMLAAIAAQIVLARRGIELAGVWRELSPTRGSQLRAASPWWIMSGASFLVGATVAAALSRSPLPWPRFRLLRWAAGAVVVATLAHIGHSAALKVGVAIGIHVAASFAAIGAAGLTALFGAYFAAKR